MLGRIAASPSKTFLYCTGAFVLGATLHALIESTWWPGLGPVTIGIAAILLAVWRRPRTRTLCLIATLFLAGIVRYDLAIRLIDTRPADLPSGTSEFTGTVASEPTRTLRQTILEVKEVTLWERGARRTLEGSAQVTIGTLERVRVGDLVRWHCRPDTDEGSTRSAIRLLFLNDIGWTCRSSGGIEVVSRAEVGLATTALIAARDGFRHSIRQSLPEPESSFLLGLYIGDRDGLPSELTDVFRKSGTAHITAVSGYNVSRVVDVCLFVLAVATVRRRRAAALTVFLVASFAALADGGSSVVRAAIMGGLSLVAIVLGRRHHATNALVLAAALMIVANPLVLRHDVGFQLSFAAVWGLHALGPALSKRAAFLPDFGGLRQTFGETAAATLFTMPLVLFHFGTLPAVGLIANLFILPLVPWAMSAGAVMVVLGFIHPAFALMPAFVTYWSLRVIEGLAGFFALAAPLSVTAQIDFCTAAALYVWIGLLSYALTKAEPIVIYARSFPTGRLSCRASGTVEVEVIDYDRQT